MTNGTKPVRVVAVTQGDCFFPARFFEAFLEGRSSDRLDLVEIVLLRNFNESKPALVRRLLQLYGPVDFMRLLGRYVTAAVSDRVGRPRSVEAIAARRSEEHTSELQSPCNIVCRLLLEKKKSITFGHPSWTLATRSVGTP